MKKNTLLTAAAVIGGIYVLHRMSRPAPSMDVGEFLLRPSPNDGQWVTRGDMGLSGFSLKKFVGSVTGAIAKIDPVVRTIAKYDPVTRTVAKTLTPGGGSGTEGNGEFSSLEEVKAERAKVAAEYDVALKEYNKMNAYGTGYMTGYTGPGSHLTKIKKWNPPFDDVAYRTKITNDFNALKDKLASLDATIAAGEQVIYKDENGNIISKEEYDRLVAEFNKQAKEEEAAQQRQAREAEQEAARKKAEEEYKAAYQSPPLISPAMEASLANKTVATTGQTSPYSSSDWTSADTNLPQIQTTVAPPQVQYQQETPAPMPAATQEKSSVLPLIIGGGIAAALAATL